jgi:hypothetical protein
MSILGAVASSLLGLLFLALMCQAGGAMTVVYAVTAFVWLTVFFRITVYGKR